MNKLMEKLKNPPKDYRAVPFWSWNDKLDPEFLRWQVREMEKAGLGGYFMHARGGLQTEYMSEDWMECIDACIDEGNKLGMYSWCYDEEGWPSGFAGGKVTSMGDKYHVRWLEFEQISEGIVNKDNAVLGIYELDASGGVIRIDTQAITDNTEKNQKLVIRQKSNPYYIDILNKDVIKAFIEVTHEEYYNKFMEHFGKGMPGFFTDEPQYSTAGIPWSYIIPQEFKAKHGYDILDVLPALFVECQGYEKIRYDFWSLVSELYATAFGKQIYEWCEERNCKLTGHVMCEDSLHSQMVSTAGAMPFYEYMHIPGMDWLGRFIQSPVIPRQVSSVANQLGKPFILSEMYALCGWDVSFEELKWIAEWQYVNGVNFMCQHLEGYTLRGLRKRDYPPSMFYQQSWWEEYKAFNDYFARLGVLLADGRNTCSVLLLHPIRSGWIAYNRSYTAELQKLDKDFVWATETLSGLHIDHHYGDETIIANHGKVNGSKFIVGQYEYNVVIMPSMLTLDQYTADLLQEFANNGGLVISIGDFPTLISGIKSETMTALKEKTVCAGEDTPKLYTLLQGAGVSVVSITQKGDEVGAIHSRVIELENSKACLMVNHSQTETFNTKVKFSGIHSVAKLDAETGEITSINTTYENGMSVITLDFLPMQSHVIVLGEMAHDTLREDTQCIDQKSVIKPGKAWKIDEMDLNSMTLDYCRYSIDQGDWQGPVPVIKLMDILLNLKRNCEVALQFSFEVDMDLGKNREFMLALETAGEFDIIINDNNVEYKDIGWWRDNTFKKVDIKPFVKKGSNEVILKRNFYQQPKVYDVLFGENVLETEKNKLTFDTELESIYVIGDFGVISTSSYTEGERKALFTEGPFVIVDKPEDVSNGELTQQGFCFFAGTLKLSQNLAIIRTEGKRVLLDIEKPDAPLSKLFINDQPVKTLMWAPYTVDITDYVQEGDNKLTIQLFAGNRNLLGPHHHKQGELYFVGPSSFTDKPGWADGGETDIWRDRYCFVRFGV